MPKHLRRELETLEKKLLFLASLTEDQVRNAVIAVEKKDAAAAVKIIEADREIDFLEIEIEEDCLKLLALHQPVAVDLRFIVAVLKINSDLERIADLAVNIADKATRFSKASTVVFEDTLMTMCDTTVTMLRMSLDALFTMNPAAARKVCTMDEKVDEFNRNMIGVVKEGIRENVDLMNDFLLLLSVSRNIERIADHATNIAEDVLYLIEGEIVRHLHSLNS